MNSLSETMEARRFCVDSVERRREERVLERFGVLEICGNMISASFKGCDILIVGYINFPSQNLTMFVPVQVNWLPPSKYPAS